MSINDDDLDNDEGAGIKSLRKQYEATQKELAEARKALQEFQTVQRASTVAEILKAKGIPESAAKLYSGDDVSEDAVGKWVEAFADVFKPQTAVDDANAANAQRVNDASFGSASLDNSEANTQRVLGNPDEMLNAINTLPYDELVKLGYMPKIDMFGRPQK